MKRYATPLLALALLGGVCNIACNKAPESKDAVRAGIMDHLTKNTGLNVSEMDIVVQEVKFEGEQAVATVSFKPKASPDAGMTMPYTLDKRGGKWVVRRRSEGGSPHAGSMGGAEAMPQPRATQPPASGGAAGDLPPGHPPVGTPAEPAKK